MKEEHLRILGMIEQGVITATQGSELLLALREDEEEEAWTENAQKPDFIPAPLPPRHTSEPEPRGDAEPPRAHHPAPVNLDSKLARWRNWWYIPLSFGILVTILSGWLLYLGTQKAWAGFWIACVWLPLLFGIFLTVLSWYSHRSLWIHVRVNTGQDEWPRRIAISLPLPLRFGAWFMRTFQHRIPGIPNMENIPLDEIIAAIQNGVKPEEPIYVEVDNGPGQERVEVYIG